MVTPASTWTTAGPARRHRRPVALWLAATLLALLFAGSGQSPSGARGRAAALAVVLARRGIQVDVNQVLWLRRSGAGRADRKLSAGLMHEATAVVRATPGPEEPHDIFLVFARLSPEGALVSVGRSYNVTETSAADEFNLVGAERWFAFAMGSLVTGDSPEGFRLIDLDTGEGAVRAGWRPVERVQAALTSAQKTGRLQGLRQIQYFVEPAPGSLSLSVTGGALRVSADARRATLAPDSWRKVGDRVPSAMAGAAQSTMPPWLSAETLVERRPGYLLNWLVDRVRVEIGDEAMQYLKAVAFSARDAVRSRKEALTGDTGADAIAEELGESTLPAATRKIPIDPAIGFPPPPLKHWVTPSLPGEGVWRLRDDNPFIHTLAGLPPTFVTTFIRSDRRRKVTRVHIVLWDPRLVQLNMMAGVAEPKSATGATGAGMIPREPTLIRRLAGAMNAGFQALHGEYGMMADGVVYLPPKPYGATVALLRDGSTAFGTWPETSGIPADLLSYRQNMTPMVVDQAFNPYKRTWWGGTPADWEDRTHTVRTGICLTAEGFVAYFYGAELSPKALSRAMIQARCSYGVALDMNAGHSGFEFYKVAPGAASNTASNAGSNTAFKKLSRPLYRWEREGDVRGLDGWRFRARRLISGMGLMNFPRYIKREGRDFFYLTLRHVLPGPKLALSGVKLGNWKVKKLPQHGFPYALALALATLPSGAQARVLKIDPRMITADPTQAVVVGGAPAAVVRILPVGHRGSTLWWSPRAFELADEPSVSGALAVAQGPLLRDQVSVVAALGVQRDAGMLVYIEVLARPSMPGREVAKLLRALGVQSALTLKAPLGLALGGDTDLALEAVRLPEAADSVVMWRRRGSGARRIFRDTPVVPLKKWYPLQARRVRYFKKKKKKTGS